MNSDFSREGSDTAKPATPPGSGSLRLAAIDVGSNSIHMIVAQADADRGRLCRKTWSLDVPAVKGDREGQAKSSPRLNKTGPRLQLIPAGSVPARRAIGRGGR